ncbi:MAG TPA: hypothetical protein VIQ00_02670 [Chitinophagaceae bacterium]
MNYILQINAFYDWLETNPISDSSIVLWHGLMHINNKCGWKQEFTAAISLIQNKTGLSKSSILRARNNLKQCGLIDFKSREGNQSAAYRIVAFHTEAQTVTQSGAQSGTQTETQTVPILKLNKTKQKNIEGGKPPPAKSFKNFSEQEFIDEIKIYESLFEKDLLNSFFKYWKEKSPGGKMKFQLERTWETKLRLEKWKSNDLKYKNNGISKTFIKPDSSKSAGTNLIADQICGALNLQ